MADDGDHGFGRHINAFRINSAVYSSTVINGFYNSD